MLPLPALEVPATLQGSLMARLDRLAGPKAVAQVGAVIGREFAYALLAPLADLPQPELEAALRALEEGGLVVRRGEPPAAVYGFKHALVRDAAYESLLKSRRQILHRRLVAAIEGEFPQLADGPARAAGAPLRRRRPAREGDRLLAQGRRAGGAARGQPRGDRALPPRRRVARRAARDRWNAAAPSSRSCPSSVPR